MLHSNLWAGRLTPERHAMTCGYWYTVTAGTMAHTAFVTRDRLKSIIGYLSVCTDEAGVRVWSVVCRNETILDGATLRRALEVARQKFGLVTIAVWDGDKGEFDSEMLADPSW